MIGRNLKKIMSFVLGTKDETLMLSADDSKHLCWSIDAVLGAHSDVKSHTGGMICIGFGDMSSSLIKKKVKSRSSMEE